MRHLILAGALLAPGCVFAASNAAVPPPAPVEVAKPEVDLADAAPAKPAKGAIPMNDFIRHRQFLDVKVSPTGEWLAFLENYHIYVVPMPPGGQIDLSLQTKAVPQRTDCGMSTTRGTETMVMVCDRTNHPD